MIRTFLIAAALAFALAAPTAGARTTGPISGELPLRVNEGKHSFDTPTRTIKMLRGVATFSVLVPRKAKHRHGVAIDGGQYRNVAGAAVRPGRSSSLTIQLNPGKYTIYDPVNSNRRRGYYVKLVVLSAKAQTPTIAGDSCDDAGGLDFHNWFASGIACADAAKLADKFDSAWRKSGFSFQPLNVAGFACNLDPFGTFGLMTTCTNGAASVVFRRNSIY
ncbi:MAG: hypothetical protein QM648_10030 [Solirubrobacterales bacterium]